MTGLIIAGAIILLLLSVLLPRVYLDLSAGEVLRFDLRFWRFFRIRLFPKKEKRINLRKYSAKKLRKLREKERKKQQKAEQKAIAKQRKKTAQAKTGEAVKTPLTEQIRMIIDLLKVVLPKLARTLRIDLSHIVIRVASSDAAKTAILYGTVSQSVSYLLTLLSEVTNVKTNKDTVVDVSADFLSEKMTADIRISLSLSPFRVIGIGISALFRFLKFKFRQTTTTQDT